MMNASRRAAMIRAGGLIAAPMLGGIARPARGVSSGRPPRIKIGQIGVGHAHASKLSVYRESEDYEVVGIAESDERLRDRAAAQNVYRGLTWM